MWTLISISLALVITFCTPKIPESFHLVKNNSAKNKIITGFPFQYFEEEVSTNEMVDFQIGLIYISFMMYITISFSVLPIIRPFVEQATFISTTTTTPIERLIPNQFDSQTTQQFLLSI
jgi:hypothetical protein